MSDRKCTECDLFKGCRRQNVSKDSAICELKHTAEDERRFTRRHFDGVVETFRVASFEQHRMLEGDLGWKVPQYHQLYLDVPSFTLSDGRNIKMRVTRDVAFTFENKPMYHTNVFIYMDSWRGENAKDIWLLVGSVMHSQGFYRWWEKTSNYTIFVFGKQKGFFYYKKGNRDPKMEAYSGEIRQMLRRYNMQMFNTNKQSADRVIKNVFKNASSLLYGRVKGLFMKTKRKIYGQLLKDVYRMKQLADVFYSKFRNVIKRLAKINRHLKRIPLNNPQFNVVYSNIVSNTKVNKRKRKLQIPIYNYKDCRILKPV